MASTLLDALRKTIATPDGSAMNPSAAGGTDQTSLVSSLAQAKTGKAAPANGSSVPRASALGEEQAQSQTTSALDSLRQQGQLQSQQIGQAEEKQDTAAKLEGRQLDQRELEIADQYSRQTDQILADYQRNREKLDVTRNKARAEQLGFNLRLGNQKYMDDLKDAGRRGRLDNSLRFRDEINRTVFRDEQDMFTDDLAFHSLMRADQRTFTEQMASMDIDYALKLAETDNKQANQSMMWSGVGGLTQAGIQGYGAASNGSFSGEYQDYKDQGGTKSYTGYQREQDRLNTPHPENGSTGDLRASERY